MHVKSLAEATSYLAHGDVRESVLQEALLTELWQDCSLRPGVLILVANVDSILSTTNANDLHRTHPLYHLLCIVIYQSLRVSRSSKVLGLIL